MSTKRLNKDLKTRVPANVKRQFERIARARNLDVSDIVREALRTFLAKTSPVTNGGGK